MKGFVAVALLGLVVAGCGAGGTGSGIYSRQKTEDCLRKDKSLTIDHQLDFVASTATAGAFHVVSPENAATVVFSETLGDAQNINDAYHRFRAKNVGVDDVISQDQNVVMLFRLHPSDPLLLKIRGCLTE